MRIFEFDDITVHTGRREVRKAGALLPLSPEQYQVLAHLLAHRDRRVPSHELTPLLAEGSLAETVAELRRALGERGGKTRYIEGDAATGYRFVGRLADETAPPSPPSSRGEQPPAPPSPGIGEGPRRINWLVPAGGLFAIAAAWLLPAIQQWTGAGGANRGAPRARQLTRSTGLDMQPSFSPDGGAIVYASDRSGALELYIHHLRDGSERALTSDGRQNGEPAWSPDGASVAYSRNNGGVYLVPASGGEPKRLTSSGSKPAWSPDGNRVVFRGADATLWTVAADGSSPPKPVTKDGEPPGSHADPQFSPDGRFLALLSEDGLRSSLWERELASGRQAPVRMGDLAPVSCAYAPDSLTFYCIARGPAAGSGLYRLRRNATTRSLAMGPELLTRIEGTEVCDLRIHPRTAQMAYTTIRTISRLEALDLASGQSRPWREELGAQLEAPVFSPSGHRLAYVRRQGAAGDLWVANPDGSYRNRVSRYPSPDPFPSWSADGRALFYRGGPPPRDPYTRFSLTDGSESALLDLADLPGKARLSPDGHTLAVGGQPLTLVTLVAGKRRTLAAEASDPVWLPDSRTLAVALRSSGGTELALLAAEGGSSPRPLTRRGGTVRPFSVSADGGRIAAAANWEGAWNLWLIDAATGEARAITRNRLRRITLRDPALAPDGGRIVYVYSERQGNIELTEPLTR